MYIAFNYLNPCNLIATEGVGSPYQKIISIYAVIKKYNYKYIHIPIKIGHNYDNDKDWDKKWDNIFNFKKLSNNDEIDINEIEKCFFTENTTLDVISKNNQSNKLYLYFHTFDIFYKNPEYYFKDIQDDLINAYRENNKNIKLIYDKNKTSIAIHIRVCNDFDKHTISDFSKEVRFNLTVDMYEKLIEQLKQKYKNHDIHIFSQEKYFDVKFKNLRNIKDINIHFDDIDVFDTFHHLCNADVFVMGLSSFSIVAAYYNKNTIIYLPSSYEPVLKSWILYDGSL